MADAAEHRTSKKRKSPHSSDKAISKKRQRRLDNGSATNASAGEVDQAHAHKSLRRKRPHKVKKAGWKASSTSGGRFIDREPVFAQDEEHMILSKPSNVEVHSISESILVQSISLRSSTGEGPDITGYAPSRHQPDTIWVSTLEGRINRLRWTQGLKLGQWKVGSRIHDIVTASNGSSSPDDILYTREATRTGTWRISIHQLFGGEHASDTFSKTLYECSKPIRCMVTTPDGRVIIAAVEERLVIGWSHDEPSVSPSRLQYEWREFSAPDPITSLDVRQDHQSGSGSVPASSKAKDHVRHAPVVHVVIGDMRGSIFVYENILREILHLEVGSADSRMIHATPRKLHWHREAVSSVKWSNDGNYVISGGTETVLVLWQLDTGRRQYLPHLSAPIQNIVVSPSGSSYGLSLSDNSTMVLSTAELSPVAYFTGIQARTLPPRALPESHVRNSNGDPSHPADLADLIKTPCVSNPIKSSQLLLGVASSQSTALASSSSSGTPYLQTFDFAHSRHLARQALTRTNATNVNISPEANKISEPTVKLLEISHDGLWLATVDLWIPSPQDLDFLALDPEDLAIERESRIEIYLKFWSWNQESSVWELVTRIDAPHLSNAGSSQPARVFDLKADPVSLGFSTIGEDGSVRFWRSRRRLRNGMPVKSKGVKDLVSWDCERETSITNSDRGKAMTTLASNQGHFGESASMAYSSDGSVLAVAHKESSVQDLAVVYLIDGANGQVRQSRSGLCKGLPIGVTFTGKYLVVVSDYLVVWNTVDDIIVYGFSLNLNKSSPSPTERLALTHLASTGDTFAVSLPVINMGDRSRLTERHLRNAQSQIIVFDPNSPRPLHALLSDKLTTALVPHLESEGYIVLDIEAEVRLLSQRNKLDMPLSHRNAHGGLNSTFATVEITNRPALIDQARRYLEPIDGGVDGDESAPVVRQQQLSEVFDVGPAYTLPPIADLFDQVAGLYARRPPSP